MKVSQNDLWWSSLTTSEKISIASKIATKQNGVATATNYPECTNYWIALGEEVKQQIHDLCIDKDGFVLENAPIEGVLSNCF